MRERIKTVITDHASRITFNSGRSLADLISPRV